MHGLLRMLTPALGALALAAVAAPAAVADPVQDPIPIRPNTFFTGTVNGPASSTGAEPVIKVICPGPIRPGETGHPLAGQFVEAQEVAATPLPGNPPGFTGSLGTSIDVLFSTATSASVNPPIVLTSYFAPVAIPTTLNLPCGGAGIASFVPIPTSPTARGYALNVLFANIAV